MHPYQAGDGVTNKESARKVLESTIKVQRFVDTYTEHFGSKPLLFSEWGVGAEQTNGQWLCSLAEADIFISKIMTLGRQGILHQASKIIWRGAENW